MSAHDLQHAKDRFNRAWSALRQGDEARAMLAVGQVEGCGPVLERVPLEVQRATTVAAVQRAEAELMQCIQAGQNAIEHDKRYKATKKFCKKHNINIQNFHHHAQRIIEEDGNDGDPAAAASLGKHERIISRRGEGIYGVTDQELRRGHAMGGWA
ncbi:hypothetical protein JCM6882_005382 [Rhodosporidiobolus microsporus]